VQVAFIIVGTAGTEPGGKTFAYQLFAALTRVVFAPTLTDHLVLGILDGLILVLCLLLCILDHLNCKALVVLMFSDILVKPSPFLVEIEGFVELIFRIEFQIVQIAALGKQTLSVFIDFLLKLLKALFLIKRRLNLLIV